MHRTTIMLPSNLKTKALMFANKEDISFGELVREALQSKLNNAIKISTEPFFIDEDYFTGEIPADMASNHDQYLYGV